MAYLRGGLEQRRDLTRLPLTCCSDEALEWYNKALVVHMSYRENPVSYVTMALELDESLLLGHCLLVSSAGCKNWRCRRPGNEGWSEAILQVK